MATRFQHRLVGTIILVAIGIIFLPDILDGQKVKYQEEIAGIPLRPVLVDPVAPVSFEPLDEMVESVVLSEENEREKPATTPVETLSQPSQTVSTETKSHTQGSKQPEVSVKQKSELTQSKPKPKLAALAEPIAIEASSKPKTVKKIVAKTTAKIIGDAWHIRLGAFKNSDAVDKLVKKIRKAGFESYRLPRHKQEGQLNRLYVGPNTDRGKLEKMLPKLEKITGLKGVIKKFDPRAK